MKRAIIVLLIVAFITFFIPLAVVYLIGEKNESEQIKSEGVVSVYITSEDRVEEMQISDYLKGVVAAEMPAEFEGEALKAQAVAARTYLYSKMADAEKNGTAQSHKGAQVCTDYRHCQAYTNRSVPENISDAVDETEGVIMTYNGEIISALFHSASAGATESAVDVWGNDVPYLKSVKSDGDDKAPDYLSTASFSMEEFKSIAEQNFEGTDWSKPLITNIKRSDAGGIISAEIGGVTVKGSDLRAVYKLRSANAEIEEKDGKVVMNVRGYGHGVGMSQYGANYMAKQGSGYEEILKTYYTGIEIEQR